MSRVILVDPQYVKDNSILDNNIDDSIVRTAIWTSQEGIIQETIGTMQYNRLKEGISNNDLTVDEITLLNDYIHEVIIYNCVLIIIQDGTFKITSNGIITIAGNNDYNTVDMTVVNKIRDDYQRAMRKYTRILYDYLSFNSEKYPLFSTYSSNYWEQRPTISYSTQNFHISKYRGRNDQKKSFF